MAKELLTEREASSLDIPHLTDFVFGKEISTKRKRIFQLILDDPVFRQDDAYYLSLEEAFVRSMERTVQFIKKKKQLGLDSDETRFFEDGSISEVLTTGGHDFMFVPTIEGQGDAEQQARWLHLAKEYKILGSYTQTELGHGTHVQGIETTATYDTTREEFILNTPTLSSTKWWSGSLAIVSTHTIVIARLLIKGVDYGIHLFMVPIRSLDDHTPLPGVEVGDIGPKFGMLGMANGFLRLDNVRIPRDHMLMKYSKVTPDGTYLKPPHSKIMYGTMVKVRAGIVLASGKALAKSITIATRYSVVRRQGESNNGGPETQVLDYQTQQYKILPLIATAYALMLTGQYMMKVYTKIESEIAKREFGSLQELHITTSGLKAFCTQLSVNGVELCRLACGGHGYSRGSGLPDIYVGNVPSMTYEGENTVLYLQTARYLNKLYSQRLPSSKLVDDVSYLSSDFNLQRRSPVRTAQQFMDPHMLQEAYRQRARRMVAIAAKRYEEGLSRGLSRPDAWNTSTCDWITAATAHCHYVVMKSFYDTVQSSDLTGNNRAIMEALCALFGVFGVTKYAGEFMTDGYMSSEQIGLARDQLYSLFNTVRKEAVPLVDAFAFPDEILNSALGRYDGDVYTHLYQWAKKAPRNKKKVHDVYDKYLKDMLKPRAKL